MKEVSRKNIIIIIFAIIIIAILVFSITKTKNTNNINNSSLTGAAITAVGGNPATGLNLISAPLLRFGSRGTEVMILQKFLTDNGYSLGSIDGIFGIKTRSALMKFQLDNGKLANGIVDFNIKDLINKMITDQNAKSILRDSGQMLEEDLIDTNLPKEIQQQQREDIERRREEDLKQQQDAQRQENERKEAELKKQQENAISFVETKNTNTLFKKYSCDAKETNETLTVFTGETINEAVNKQAVYPLSDVWSTTDGVNWKKQASSTKMGAGWERMVEKDKDGVIYSFGGKYKVVDNKTVSDNSVYKSTDAVDWTYVGEIPEMNHSYDRSVVYYNEKFWLISTMEGVWNSSDGKTWTKQLNKGPWSAYSANNSKYNSWGYYNSDSLGAYVIKDKMWYLVYNGRSSTSYDNLITIFSTTDGKNWTEEGKLVNAKNSEPFYIRPNINPDPVTWNGDIYIVSSVENTGKPLVIKTSDGKNWYQVSTDDTKFYKEDNNFPNVRNYGSVAVFLNKIWHIGGWDLQLNTDNNDNVNDVWSSSDGIKWSNITPKNVEFPGPAGRWLAGIVTTGEKGSKAGNLNLERKWNDSGFFTGNDETATILGTWKMFAEKDGVNVGDVVVSYLGFVGSDFKNSKNVQFSSLETLKNIIVYADGVKVGSISSFSGPFYDSTGIYALPQRITFDKDVTIEVGKSVTFTLVADFPVPPKNKNFEMRTWLNEIGFKDSYTTPCGVSTEFYSDGYDKFPGKLIGWK